MYWPVTPRRPFSMRAEDRNGCRNHDEIQFWNVYLSDSGSDLIDDDGDPGGLPETAAFVIMGDLNADPVDGDGRREAINELISNQRLRDPLPRSLARSTMRKTTKPPKAKQGIRPLTQRTLAATETCASILSCPAKCWH